MPFKPRYIYFNLITAVFNLFTVDGHDILVGTVSPSSNKEI